MNVIECDKFIAQMRSIRGMTQVELAEDICSTKEIWRIEKGESKPNFFTFERILTKLGIDLSRYLYGFISGDDKLLYYETLEIWDCIFDHNYKSAEIKFSTLKEKEYFNINDQFCKQFSLICEAILLFKLSGKSEEALDLAYKALYTTLPKFNLKYIDKHPLVADEYRILNNIALFHISFDSIDKGIDILKRLKSSLNQKYISKELRINLLPTICYNLSKFLGQLKLYLTVKRT